MLTTVALQWRSKDSTIARVDARGNLLGLREGSTEITLDGPGMQQLVWPVTVAQARVAVAAHRFSMPTGALKPMIAELRAGDGRDFGRAASPVWTSSAPQIANRGRQRYRQRASPGQGGDHRRAAGPPAPTPPSSS